MIYTDGSALNSNADGRAGVVVTKGTMDNPQVLELLQKVWGVVRESDVDRKKLIARYLDLVKATLETNHFLPY